jgi:adenylate cyclase
MAEIDEFAGANAGLILAEIELPPGSKWPRELPSWLGEDVTEEDRYYSSQLGTTPYSTW